jgi:hypothetical protein
VGCPLSTLWQLQQCSAALDSSDTQDHIKAKKVNKLLFQIKI